MLSALDFSDLERRVLARGEPGERERALLARFGDWQHHFRCMRDDTFVANLAATLEQRLGE